MRPLRWIALTAFAIVVYGSASHAQTAQDSAHVAAQRINNDSIGAALAFGTNFCQTKTARSYPTMCKAFVAGNRRLLLSTAAESSLAASPIVAAPPAPAPTPSASPTPSPTPTTGSVATQPELPRVVPMSRDPYPGKACTVTIAGPADPNAVNTSLIGARGGTIICPSPGLTFAPLSLPKRIAGDTGYIVIRCNCTLPAEGTRMSPTTALPRFVATLNAQSAMTAEPSASGYALRGLEFTTASTVTLTYGLVLLGDATQTTVALLPNHLILSQVIVRGQPAQDLQRCIALNAAHVAIVDSYLAECHGKGYDSQAIGGWSGTGPYNIENNYLEGAGENLMLGGSQPAAEGLVASDVTISRNYFYTPPSWKDKILRDGKLGTRWSKKNLLELKVCHRCLIVANDLNGSWTDAQTGTGVLFKSSADAPWHGMNTEDITMRFNRMWNVGSAFSVTGRENYQNPAMTALYPDETTQRILIEDNYVDSINVGIYTTDDIKDDGTIVNQGARMLNLGGPPHGVRDLTVRRNTMVTTGPVQHFITLHADPTGPAVDRFDYQNNLVTEGEYGIAGGRYGKAALDSLTVPYTFTNNVIIKGSGNWTYPATTTLVSSLAAAPSTAGASLSVVNTATQGVKSP